MEFSLRLQDWAVIQKKLNFIIKNGSAYIITFLIWGFHWDSALVGIDELFQTRTQQPGLFHRLINITIFLSH